MADTERHLFGVFIADWVFKSTEDGVPLLQGGATVDFWVDRDSDTQYTGFTADKAGNVPLEAVVTSSGGAGYQLGDLTAFYGPVGRKWMWASVDLGPRKIIFCSDLAEIVDDAILDTLLQGKGDLIVATAAGEPARLPINSDGRVLTADSSQATGMRWAIPAGGSGITDASDTLWVAAADAPSGFGDGDYNCDGIADEAEINTALANVFGFKVALSPGSFQLAAPVQLLGSDNATIAVTRSLRGCGTATVLTAASGLTGAIQLTNAVCPQVADLTIQVTGASHGIYSTASAGALAGKRSFFDGEIRGVKVRGSGTPTGWGMSLSAGIRYVVTGCELTGLGNGVRVVNADTTLSAGQCEFRRVHVEVSGTGATAYAVSSPTGSASQVLFDTCTAVTVAASTGTTALKVDGAGGAAHIRARNCSASQFDTTVSIASTCSDVDVDFALVTAPTGSSTFASVAGYSNRVRAGLLNVPASATVVAVSETNAYAAKPNLFDLDIYADTSSTVTATLLTGMVTRGVSDGAGTVAGVLKQQGPQGQVVSFTKDGTVTAPASGKYIVWNNSGHPRVLRCAQASLATAFTTGATTIDINLNGVSIFPGGTNRPSIPAAATTSGRATTGIDGVIWPAGVGMTVDIDTAGTAGPGSDLIVQIDTYN